MEANDRVPHVGSEVPALPHLYFNFLLKEKKSQQFYDI